MKLIKTTEAAGKILCHDMTRIVPGEVKETRFRKGRIIQEEDISVLLEMGKDELYIWEVEPGMVHEEEGAVFLRDLAAGENIRAEAPREGKVELFAERRGLFKVNSRKLVALNSLGGIGVITRRGNRAVEKRDKLAALKIIPLLIEEAKLKEAAAICGGEKILSLLPYSRKKAGLIITGNELYHKRIPDRGSAIIAGKIESYGGEAGAKTILDDDPEKISAEILRMIDMGMDLVICSGGMSVDPDDKTPLAIKKSGARIVTYGVPLMPGTMLLLAYFEKPGVQIPVIGAPACVFYEKVTALDFLLPRIMAGDIISREELALLGEGGLFPY
jgi:molybdenum cofactor synthesis domain-containing protein